MPVKGVTCHKCWHVVTLRRCVNCSDFRGINDSKKSISCNNEPLPLRWKDGFRPGWRVIRNIKACECCGVWIVDNGN